MPHRHFGRALGESGKLAHGLDDGGETEKIARADAQHLRRLWRRRSRGDTSAIDDRSSASRSAATCSAGDTAPTPRASLEPVGVDAGNRHQHHGEHLARPANPQQRLDQSRFGVPALGEQRLEVRRRGRGIRGARQPATEVVCDAAFACPRHQPPRNEPRGLGVGQPFEPARFVERSRGVAALEASGGAGSISSSARSNAPGRRRRAARAPRASRGLASSPRSAGTSRSSRSSAGSPCGCDP